MSFTIQYPVMAYDSPCTSHTGACYYIFEIVKIQRDHWESAKNQ
jgi:hypothetical protein